MDSQARERVPCPCCKGDKRMWIEEIVDGVTITTVYDCCHCQGRGTVPAEVNE